MKPSLVSHFWYLFAFKANHFVPAQTRICTSESLSHFASLLSALCVKRLLLARRACDTFQVVALFGPTCD